MLDFPLHCTVSPAPPTTGLQDLGVRQVRALMPSLQDSWRSLNELNKLSDPLDIARGKEMTCLKTIMNANEFCNFPQVGGSLEQLLVARVVRT